MIDDESKKFIKNTVEDAIDKKFDDRDRKSAYKQRLDELKYEKRSAEDRKRLLEELKERDKKGETTIAQKFEMLKLSVDDAIPEELKDAAKTGTETMGKGFSQMGRGLGHLTQRAMMSNPVTAFLYANRDILGAGLDVGVGALKAGWGAIKGIGHGALGLANMASKMFRKPNEEEEGEESEDNVNPIRGLFSSKDSTVTENIIGEKEDWKKKIDKIHEVVTKDSAKEQKKSTSILSKGLAGLNKTMAVVSGFVDMIVQKQKIILGAVLLGAVAVIGLAAWFTNKYTKKGTRNTNVSDTHNLRDTQFHKLKRDRHNDIQTAINKESTTGDIVEEQKTLAGKDRDGNNTGIINPFGLISGYKMKANAGQPYRAPFDLKVISWDQNNRNPNGIDMEVERISTVLKKNAVIMNIENPIRVAGQTAKKGEIIGQVPSIGEIFIKDISKAEFEDYKKLIDEKATRSEEQKQQEIRDVKAYLNASQSNKIRNSFSALLDAQRAKGNAPFEDGKVTKRDAQNQASSDAKAGIAYANEKDDTADKKEMRADRKGTLGGTIKAQWNRYTYHRENWDRAKQQQEELKKKPEKQETPTKTENTTNNQQQNLTIKEPNDSIAYKFADIGCNTSEAHDMMGNLIDMSGVC